MKDTQRHTNNYLIKQLPKAIAFINRKFEIVHASDQWINEFQFNSIDVFGKTIFTLFYDVTDDWKKVLKDCLMGKPGDIQTKRYIDSSENEKWLQWSHIPWYDDEENIIGVIVQAEDVTHKVLNDLKLEKLQGLLKEKSEIAKIGTWEFDALTGTVSWSQMTKKIHGASEDFIPTLTNVSKFYKEGSCRNTFSMALYDAMEKGTSWNEKLLLVQPDDTEKWIMASGRAIMKGKEFIGLIGTFQDITEQEKLTIKTKKNERLLQTLIDNLPLNVHIKDNQSRKILVNKSECDFMGAKSPEELLGKSDFDVYDKETAEILRNEDLTVLKTLEPMLSKETLIVKKDGTKTTFLTSKIPLKDSLGKASGLVGICLDISEIKQKEEELKDLINVTSLQNKKLINFAHIISHNLRSHTANFSMLLEFLIHEEDPDEKQRITKMLVNSSDNLLETLDNLNEVVAINTNVNATKETIRINGYVKTIEENLEAFLINNNGQIINTISNNVQINVVPTYIESILMNFITNAIKYKEPGRKPIVRLSAESKDGYTILTIKDNGSGIDLKKYGHKLFGMYKTFHSNLDSRGIGLYIAKNQIEAMNGKVEVQSKVGRGTTFRIYFNEED